MGESRGKRVGEAARFLGFFMGILLQVFIPLKDSEMSDGILEIRDFALGNSGMFQDAPGCYVQMLNFSVCKDSLGFSGILWDSLGFSGILWDSL